MSGRKQRRRAQEQPTGCGIAKTPGTGSSVLSDNSLDRSNQPIHSITRFPRSFPFFVSSVALSWCHVFSRFSTRFSTRFQAQKKRHREGHATPFHTLVPRSSLAVPGTPSATSQRSQFVDATGTLWQDWAPSPVCYGAPHRRFG